MRYQPIEDYGVIGNLRTVALVGKNGSIDWLCWPRFDSRSVFARVLDAERGGFFAIRPRGEFRVERRYVDNTNVLETTFETGSGRARLVEAAALAPARYRSALFEFLLDTAECSGSALREAGRLIAELSPSEPEAEGMRMRLKDAARRRGAADTRLGTIFLCVPRTTVRAAALPGALTGGRAGGSPEEKTDGRRRTVRRAPGAASSRPPATP